MSGLDQFARLPSIVALVDDDAALRHALAFALEAAGFSVQAFADAETALAADWSQWRCLLLDQRLPRLSGLGLLAQLQGAGFQAPVIVITTHPSQDTLARARAAGAEVLEKPLLDDELLRRVRQLTVA